MKPMAPLVILMLAFVSIIPLQGAAQATTAITMLCDAKVPTAPADPPTTIRKMEATYLDQTYGFGVGCWAHVGIQQYFIGVDRIYTLKSATLSAMEKEQIQSPPIEGSPTSGHVYIETSMDGKNWDLLTEITGMASGVTKSKTLTNLDKDFRFIRAREPLSAAQGLSGYLDYFYGTLNVLDDGPAPLLTPTGAPETSKITCSDGIMEDPVATHPCWYGGVNHWDSWSGFHTYFLGDARLDTVAGGATLGYIRYASGTAAPPGTLLKSEFNVQVSADGRTWTTLGSVFINYDYPTSFSFGGLNDLEAKFVRLASTHHPGFDDNYQFGGQNPSLRRTEGYFIASNLELQGEFL